MHAATLDPLAPTPRGLWCTHGVRVRRRRGPHRRHGPDTVCTKHFCATRNGQLLTVEHDVTPDDLCDELAVLLAEELVDSGVLRGHQEFEKVFTGVVRSTVDGGLQSWLRFYRNSLIKLEQGSTAFAPVHAWATDQICGGQLVDLGSCFGFFPLRLARKGIQVTATDVSGSTMQLLARMSAQLRRPLTTLTCDAARVPLPSGAADTVTALHLLEHLPAEAMERVLDEALRLARRRVVVAVPFEDELRQCYGHVQQFDLPSLHRTADSLCRRHPGVRARVYELHGGWLILDRRPA